ncbi:MAG: hypothetical protein LBM95_02960 [Lactobacillales bacterium]|jgi:hypothetical protein|nr:hypothetical protein [Lactobacillales bacterium]
MRNVLQKVGYVFLYTAIIFLISTLLPKIIHKESIDWRLISLCVIYPLTTMIGSMILARVRQDGFFVLYLLVFCSVHFILQSATLGRLDLLWIMAWQVIPSLIFYGWCYSTPVIEED